VATLRHRAAVRRLSMKGVRTTLAVLLAVALVVAAGWALGWFRPRPAVSPPPTSDMTPAPPTAGTSPPASRPFTRRGAPRPPAGQPPPAVNPPAEPGAAGATNRIADWAEKIDEVLRADGDATAAGRALLELLPRFPEAGQVEAVQHIVNLLDDADYAPLARLAADPTTAEEVLEVVLADLLNRPNAVKLPALLGIARQSDHPRAGEAKELLELYLEEDFGNDWARWESRMQEWLQAHPD